VKTVAKILPTETKDTSKNKSGTVFLVQMDILLTGFTVYAFAVTDIFEASFS